MSAPGSVLPPSPPPEIVLEAGRADASYWRDLWRYRELAGFLAWRDIKVRYKQAVLGIAWAVVQPAVQTLLLTFVFGTLAGMRSGAGVPYALITLTGLLPWQLFTGAFTGAGQSLVGNSHLVSKVYFPRLLVPVSALAVALLDFGVLLTLALPVVWLAGFAPGWPLLLLPVFVLLALALALGAGLWITALTVQFRDFRFITPFILQIGMFVTPVGYRSDFLGGWGDLLMFNPLTGVVGGFRWSLLGSVVPLDLTALGLSVNGAVLLLVSGLWYFRRTERRFADVI